MKLHKYAIMLMLLPQLACCQKNHTMEYDIKVVDEDGKAVPDCKVGTSVFLKWKSGEGFGSDITSDKDVLTNNEGVARFKMQSTKPDMSYMVYPSNEFYIDNGQRYIFKTSKNEVWQPNGEKFEVVIKRVKTPIAMYAKKAPQAVPVFGKAIAYDLMVGDWIAPQGKGKVGDIVFTMNTEKYPLSKEELKKHGSNPFGKSILKVSFNNEGDGLIPFDVASRSGSIFRSAHEAPEKGYQNKLIHTRVLSPQKKAQDTRSKTINYYIRVRTKLDEKGNVISAYYGKIYGDFMEFTHYLNPKSNDRNIEFDPKKNLIDTGFRGHKVQNP